MEAIKFKPEYAEAFYNRGYAKFKLNDYQGSLADYTEAIRLKADYAEAFYGRGYCEVCIERFSRSHRRLY